MEEIVSGLMPSSGLVPAAPTVDVPSGNGCGTCGTSGGSNLAPLPSRTVAIGPPGGVVGNSGRGTGRAPLNSFVAAPGTRAELMIMPAASNGLAAGDMTPRPFGPR